MPCDRRLKRGQTIRQRIAEVEKVKAKIESGLVTGGVQIKVGLQGGVVFTGLTDEERDGVTDNCVYRRLMVSGSALAQAAILRAETLAGRRVDQRMIAQGAHSHDGGESWHDHK